MSKKVGFGDFVKFCVLLTMSLEATKRHCEKLRLTISSHNIALSDALPSATKKLHCELSKRHYEQLKRQCEQIVAKSTKISIQNIWSDIVRNYVSQFRLIISLEAMRFQVRPKSYIVISSHFGASIATRYCEHQERHCEHTKFHKIAETHFFRSIPAPTLAAPPLARSSRSRLISLW